MEEGFYVNLGLYPAVPVKNTGVRITISRHNEKEEMKALVDAMVYHYPKALEETHTTKIKCVRLSEDALIEEGRREITCRGIVAYGSA